MAIAHVFFAAMVGLVVAIFGFATTDIGLLGAFGLYVAAGWASILASLGAQLMVPLFRRLGSILPDRRRRHIALGLDRRQPERPQ